MRAIDFDRLSDLDFCNIAIRKELHNDLKELEVLKKQAQPTVQADADKDEECIYFPECVYIKELCENCVSTA